MGSVRDLHGVPMEFVRGPHGTGKGFVWGSYGLAIEKSLRRGRKASPSAGHALRSLSPSPGSRKASQWGSSPRIPLRGPAL